MINTASFHFRQDKDFLHNVDIKNDDNDSKYIIVTFGGLSKADYDLCLFMTPEQALQLGENIVHVVKNCEPGGTRFCESCGNILASVTESEWEGYCQGCADRAAKDTDEYERSCEDRAVFIREYDDRDMDDNKFFYKE